MNYDIFFKMSANEFFGDIPEYNWCWLKAQGMAESTPDLDPLAESDCGALGVMQIMPLTWKEIQRKLKDPMEILHAQDNIRAGAFYLRQMWDKWTEPRSFTYHLELALASYNAGFGHILEAQKRFRILGDGEIETWSKVRPYLHCITGDLALQTIGYVERIFRYYDGLIANS